jgi:hypothetical protein
MRSSGHGPTMPTPTPKQELGEPGERLVAQHCPCPKCKQRRTLKRLATNFKGADVICNFCGYLAQVKASTSRDGKTPPKRLLGAAWGPRRQRMDAGIHFPLFPVLEWRRLSSRPNSCSSASQAGRARHFAQKGLGHLERCHASLRLLNVGEGAWPDAAMTPDQRLTGTCDWRDPIGGDSSPPSRGKTHRRLLSLR